MITPAAATLARTGFPRRSTGPQALPDYDYSERADFADMRYPEGEYTAFGPVLPLVAEEDDALLTIGPGEEAQLEFDAPADAPGWQRRYVLDVRGYAKDMDMYTRDGETVGPLPARLQDEDSIRRREALHASYYVRHEQGQ